MKAKANSNSSGITPVGPRLLILPDAVEEATKSGIVVAVGVDLQREELGQSEGVVVALGDQAWFDKPQPWAKLGDRVIFTKFAGVISMGADKQKYRIIKDLDVVAVKAAATATASNGGGK